MSMEARPIRLSPAGKLITVAIIVALALLVIRGLGSVIIPFIAAAITAYLFNPLITWLHRRTRIGRGVWIGVLYVVAGLLVYTLVVSMGPVVVRQYNELIAALPATLNSLQQQILLLGPMQMGDVTVDIEPLNESLRNAIVELARQLPERVPHLVAIAFETVLLFVTYLMITYYLLLQANEIMEWVYGLVPAPYRAEIRGLGRQIDGILAGYIRGTLLLIPIMAALTYVALTIMGVRYALVLAIFSGVVEIIPLIGPWTAALTAISVALFQVPAPFDWPHWLVAAVIGLIYFVLRMFEDNFIIPHVVGPAVHLHPMLVIFAILAGGALGGPFGLFVSIPVAAVARLLLRYLYYKLIDAPELPPPPDEPGHPVATQTIAAESAVISPAPSSGSSS
ncbi:MAG TPA: AI-2E family transporter [Roseiflexaceae bacterium]|nr:AI-2E family transporter [Roseiflexaceae bacterium]